MIRIVVLLVILAGTAHAQVVLQPTASVQPAFPVQAQDFSVGYRHDELPGMSANGFALRAVVGVPGWPLDGEGMMSGAWGYVGDNLVGHAQISLAPRLVLAKPGMFRPFVLAAPLVDIARAGSDEVYSLGANAVGLDVSRDDLDRRSRRAMSRASPR